MEFGIALLSIIPVRSEPAHRSEMVTQLLFGELYRILEQGDEWTRIGLIWDDYEGWIPRIQLHPLPEAEFLRLFDADTPVSMDLVQLLSNNTRKTVIPLVMGSSLPGLTDGGMTIGDDHFTFEGSTTGPSRTALARNPQEVASARRQIIDDALLFLNAPYLWGGRTPFGTDCSGFVQLIYKLHRIKLMRDAAQQATQGEGVALLDEAEPGDLAFFDNPEGAIIHVGLLIDRSHIIHCSGQVRIDPIDHHGIYNSSLQRYTHTLRLIKRVL